MIHHLLMTLLAYAALVADASSGGWSLPEGTAPLSLYLVAAVALLHCNGAGAIFWATVVGLLSDVLSRGPIGLNVVMLANLAFFAQICGVRGARDSVFASGGVVWVYVTLAASGRLFLRALLRGDMIDPVYLGQYAAGRAGASVALFLAVMLLWRLIGRSLQFVVPSARVGRDRRAWAN